MRHVLGLPSQPGHWDRRVRQYTISYSRLRGVQRRARWEEGVISIDVDTIESEMRSSCQQDPIAAVNVGESIFRRASQMKGVA